MKSVFGASYCVGFLKSILTFSVALASTSAVGQLRTQLDQDLKSLSGGNDNQQVTTCRINSKELLATAESTARAILQGICNPRKSFVYFFSIAYVASRFVLFATRYLLLLFSRVPLPLPSQKRRLHLALIITSVRLYPPPPPPKKNVANVLLKIKHVMNVHLLS